MAQENCGSFDHRLIITPSSPLSLLCEFGRQAVRILQVNKRFAGSAPAFSFRGVSIRWKHSFLLRPRIVHVQVAGGKQESKTDPATVRHCETTPGRMYLQPVRSLAGGKMIRVPDQFTHRRFQPYFSQPPSRLV